MNKRKSFSSPISFKNAFEKSLTKNFLAKYEKYSNQELQAEIDKIQKQNTILKLTNESLEREDQEYVLSRNQFSDAFSMLSKYNSFLQTETQNKHIQLNFDIEKETDDINELRKETISPNEQTSVNSIEICKNQGGNEFFNRRQRKIEQSLENRQRVMLLKEKKKQFNNLMKEMRAKQIEYQKIQNKIKDKQNQLDKIKQENIDIEQELQQYHEEDNELSKIIEEITLLQQRKENISKIKQENISLEKQIQNEKSKLQERKTSLYLELPSAQDPWPGRNSFESQIGSLQELIEERNSLRFILQKREEKLNKARNDFNETLAILQASLQAISQYQENANNI